MNIKRTSDLSVIFRQYEELKKISHSLSGLDTDACNYGLTEKQKKRVEKLELKAEMIAEQLKVKAYHQGDSRGVSLYLIEKNMDNTNYNYGVPIY